MANTADRLLQGLKRRSIIPSSQPLFGNSDLLALADDVIRGKVVPLLIGIRQDFLVTTSLTPTVVNQAAYAIPYRAVGRTLRDLKMVDSGGSVRDLALLAIEDEHLFQAGGGSPHGFYFKGDKVVLVPPPQSALTSLEFWWECPPGRLVETSSASVVTGFTATTVTVDQVPTSITTGTNVDFIAAKSGNAPMAIDKAVTNVAGLTYTFAAGAIPADLAVGDYISVAQTSPVIMIPDECYPMLETLVSQRILNALGDFEGAQALGKDVSEEEKAIKMLLEPRIRGEATVIVNRRGLLRSARIPYRRGIIY